MDGSSSTNTMPGRITFKTTPTTFSAALERMRIDSSGNVGIGNTNPGSFHSSGENLVVGSGSGEEGMTIYSGTGSGGVINFADGTTTSDSYEGRIIYNHSDNSMRFHVNDGGKRMTIDSDGRLLLGQTSDTDGSLCMNGVLAFSAGGNGTASTSNARPNISRGADGQLLLAAGKDSGSSIRFDVAASASTNAAEVMLINSSGNVGIGTSSPSYLLHLQDLTSPSIGISNSDTSLGQDQLIGSIEFTKSDASGAGVGSCGSVKLRSQDSYGARTFLQFNIRENANSGEALETEKARVDLYGVKVNNGNVKFDNGFGIDFSLTADSSATGATATSELLDDYEEGTWTPTAVSFSGTLGVTSASYVKVGRLIHVQGYVSIPSTSDTAAIKIGNLPFSALGTNSSYSLLTAHTNGGLDNLALRAQGTTNVLTAVHLSSGDGDSKPTYAGLSNKFIIFGGTYQTT